MISGGDVKLLTVLALWIQLNWFLELFNAVLVGRRSDNWYGAWHVMRRQRDRLAIPYGVVLPPPACGHRLHHLPIASAVVEVFRW
jgi:prepilin peptidase CpaA